MPTYTQKELEISNKSYTNKDFESIYTELLDYAEKISKRFSPVDSNETDPFVILLKLVAFVSDKTNYNIDKNILERFMLSCTQEKSMNELTSICGYNMHFYMSAETEVYFKYAFKKEDEEDKIVTINKYSKVTDGGNIQYVTLEPASLKKSENISKPIQVIQGQIKDLEVLGEKIIQLENLNDQRIIYFPEHMVAQNGVFIENVTSNNTEWKSSDNLNSELYGSTCFKFGYDSIKKRPYIEFPEWISMIIKDGLYIKYIVTDGLAGNVAARALNSVTRISKDDSIEDTDIVVYNLSAANNGKNPETIDDAYKGFKKTIGTFDTLVTCRDYANAIYNLMNPVGNAYVSNIIVGDKRNDINYSSEVLTMNDSGIHYESQPLQNADHIDKILPHDICLYAFNPITNTTASAIDDANGYNQSFNALSSVDTIEKKIDSYASISQNFKDLNDTDIQDIQIDYKLDATVSTVKKVNSLEQYDILKNISNAIISKYNCREINPGCEIAYDELLEVMTKADARIKFIALAEPEQTPIVKLHDPAQGNTDDAQANSFKFIVAKNVLSGKISAISYDDSFKVAYSADSLNKVPKVASVSTAVNITLTNDTQKEGFAEYKLKDNEVIQFLAPNLLPIKTYPYGVNYYLYLADTATNVIKMNSDYKLKANDVIVLSYTDSNGNLIIDEYKGPTNAQDPATIFTPNFDLETTRSKQTRPTKSGIGTGEYSNTPFYTLGAKEEIVFKKINKQTLDTFKRCFWLTNAADNNIDWIESPARSNKYYYILKDDEYFFYTDSTYSSLVAVGAGTKLYLNGPKGDWTHTKELKVDDIMINGLSALTDAFIGKTFDKDFNLTIVENEIINLTAGCSIKAKCAAGGFTITDTFKQVKNNLSDISYKLNDGKEIILPDKESLDSDSWNIRSVLDLNVSPESEQILLDNQTITFTTDKNTVILNGSEKTITVDGVKKAPFNNNIRFKFNVPVIMNGGTNINLKYTDLIQGAINPELLIFETDSTIENDIKIKKYENNFISIQLTNEDEKNSATLNVNAMQDLTGETTAVLDRILMIYVPESVLDTETIKITANSGDANLYHLNYDLNTAKSTIDLNKGVNIIKVVGNNCKNIILTLTNEQTTIHSNTLMVSEIKYIKDINSELGLKDSLSTFLTYLNTNFNAQYKKFYINADLDKNKQIEIAKSSNLLTAEAFYDVNNVANKWVIPKIDLKASNIVIAKSSRI